MMVYKKYKVKDVPTDLYKKLDSLNLRENGSMRDTLRTERKYSLDNEYVFIALDDDIVIGWALILENLFFEYALQIYTRKLYRRRGIGLKLIEQIIKFLIANKKNQLFTDAILSQSPFLINVKSILKLKGISLKERG